MRFVLLRKKRNKMLAPKKPAGSNPQDSTATDSTFSAQNAIAESAFEKYQRLLQAGAFGQQDIDRPKVAANAANALSKLRNFEASGAFDEDGGYKLPQITPEQRDDLLDKMTQLSNEELADRGAAASSLDIDTRKNIARDLTRQLYGIDDSTSMRSEQWAAVPRSGIKDVDKELERRQFNQRLDEIGYLERIRSGGASATRGLVGVFTGTIKSVPEVAKSIGSHLPEWAQGIDPELMNGEMEDRFLYNLGVGIENFVEKYYPANPELQEDFWATTVPQAIGSMAGFAVGSLGKTSMVAILGAGATADESFQDAIASGASSQEQLDAAALGALLGLSEALPWINFGEGRTLLGAGLRGFSEEFTQESMQSVGQNAIANSIVGYDPDRGFFEGVGEAGAAGGISGFLMAVAMGAARRKLKLQRGHVPAGRAEEIGAILEKSIPQGMQPGERSRVNINYEGEQLNYEVFRNNDGDVKLERLDEKGGRFRFTLTNGTLEYDGYIPPESPQSEGTSRTPEQEQAGNQPAGTGPVSGGEQPGAGQAGEGGRDVTGTDQAPDIPTPQTGPVDEVQAGAAPGQPDAGAPGPVAPEQAGQAPTEEAAGQQPVEVQPASQAPLEGNEGLSYLVGKPGEIDQIGEEAGLVKKDGISVLKSPEGSYRYVFSQGGRIVSALQVLSKDGKKGVAANVYTAPEFRRQGLASQLLEKARSDFESIEMSDDLSQAGQAFVEATQQPAGQAPAEVDVLAPVEEGDKKLRVVGEHRGVQIVQGERREKRSNYYTSKGKKIPSERKTFIRWYIGGERYGFGTKYTEDQAEIEHLLETARKEIDAKLGAEEAPAPTEEAPAVREVSIKDGTVNVRRGDDGRVSITNTKTGRQVTTRSSNYRPAVSQWLRQNSRALDREPRVVDEKNERDISIEDFPRVVAQRSTNPLEIIEAYAVAKSLSDDVSTGDPIEVAARDMAPFSTDSFDTFGDPNVRKDDKGMSLRWLAKDGVDLDVAAKEISEAAGFEVTPQDLVDFIMRNPRGANEFDEQTVHLRERFREVTGITLSEEFADQLLDELYEPPGSRPGVDPVVPFDEEFQGEFSPESPGPRRRGQQLIAPRRTPASERRVKLRRVAPLRLQDPQRMKMARSADQFQHEDVQQAAREYFDLVEGTELGRAMQDLIEQGDPSALNSIIREGGRGLEDARTLADDIRKELEIGQGGLSIYIVVPPGQKIQSGPGAFVVFKNLAAATMEAHRTNGRLLASTITANDFLGPGNPENSEIVVRLDAQAVEDLQQFTRADEETERVFPRSRGGRPPYEVREPSESKKRAPAEAKAAVDRITSAEEFERLSNDEKTEFLKKLHADFGVPGMRTFVDKLDAYRTRAGEEALVGDSLAGLVSTYSYLTEFSPDHFETVVNEAFSDPNVRIMASALPVELREASVAALNGKRITSVEDLAAMAMIYRDPRMETVRYIYVRETDKGAMEIVGQNAISTRMAGSSEAFPAPEITGRVRKQQESGMIPDYDAAMKEWLEDEMAKRGATGFYMLHNHPSGKVDVSRADIQVTERVERQMLGKLRGHIVINGGKYSLIRFRQKSESQPWQTETVIETERAILHPEKLRAALKNASVEEVEDETGKISYADRLLQTDPSYDHPQLGTLIMAPEHLAAVFSEVQGELRRNWTIIGTDSRGFVRQIIDVSPGFIASRTSEQIGQVLIGLSRTSGSNRYFLAGTKIEPEDAFYGVMDHFKDLIRNNVFMDVFVSDPGISVMEHHAIPVRTWMKFGQKEEGARTESWAAEPTNEELRRAEEQKAGREAELERVGNNELDTNENPLARSWWRPVLRSVQRSVDQASPIELAYEAPKGYPDSGQEHEPVPYEMLARTIPEELADTGNAMLLGKVVRGPADLAAIAQIYRDPRVETMRWVMVKTERDGRQRVVGEVSISANLPATVPSMSANYQLLESAERTSRPKEEKTDPFGEVPFASKALVQWVSLLMKRYGADSFYMVHNHPSGNPRMSNGDLHVTRNVVMAFPDQMLGHIIIDSGKFGLFTGPRGGGNLGDPMDRTLHVNIKDEDIKFWEIDINDPETLERAGFIVTEEDLAAGRKGFDMLTNGGSMAGYENLRGLNTRGDGGIFEIAQQTHIPENSVVLVGTTARGEVRGVMRVSLDVLQKNWVHFGKINLEFARGTGSRNTYIVGVPSKFKDKATIENDTLRILAGRGAVVDVIFDDSASGRYHEGMEMWDAYKKQRHFYGLPLWDYFGAAAVDVSSIISEGEFTGIEGEGSLRDQVRQRAGQLRQQEESAGQAEGVPLEMQPRAGEGAVLGAKKYPDQGDVQSSMARHFGRIEMQHRALRGVTPVSSADCIRAFESVMHVLGKNVPIRTRLRRRGTRRNVLGFYKVGPEVIRIRTAGDVTTSAHELGHALQHAAFGSHEGDVFKKTPGITPAMLAELEQLGRDLYGDEVPVAGYEGEGFAEFMAFWLTGNKKAPKFTEYFEGEFMNANPAMAQALKEARTIATQFNTQGPVNRARAGVVQKTENWFRNVKNTLRPRNVSRLWIDELSPLLSITEEAERLTGARLPIDKNPYLAASALQKTHTARVRYMVENGMIDIAGNQQGPALKDAVAVILNSDVKGAKTAEEKREAFTVYLWARRALKLWQPSEKWPDGRNPGLSYDDAQAIFDYYDSREFDIAANMIYQWNDGVIDYGAVAFGQEFAEAIKGGDVGDYVPLQRVFDDLNDMAHRAARRSGTGAVLGGDPIKALKGSGRRIRDPFQAMIEKAEQMVLATHKRYILNQLVALQSVPGIGAYIERVSPDMVPQSISLQRVIDELAKLDFAVDYRPPGAEKPSDEDPIDKRERIEAEAGWPAGADFLTFFTEARLPNSPDPILPIWQNGKVEWYQVDFELFDSLAGMDMFYLPRVLDLMLGAPARLFRLGTTGLRPAFSLVTNPLRDVQTFFAQSRSSANPASMMVNWLQALGESVALSATDNPRLAPFLDAFHRLGGEMALPLGQDTRQTRRAVQELFEGRPVRILRHPIDHVRDLLQIPESATRAAELRLRSKQMGWSPGQPMSIRQSMQLLLDAKRVTTDFTSAGSMSKKVNQVVPFFNATIQGSRAFVRAFRDNPTRAILAGAAMTLFSLWRWWELKDEEWYNDLDYSSRFLYWYFPSEDPNGPVYLIPRPFDWGNTFSVIPEALADAWYRDDPEQFTAALGHVFETTSPIAFDNIGGFYFPTDLLGVPGSAMMEQAANYDFFFDTPIVPKREEGMPVEEQVGPFTSIAAQAIGRATGTSPRRIEHLVRSFTGGLGPDILQGADPVLLALGVDDQVQAIEREREFSDVPVVGRLAKRGGREGTTGRSVDKFYDVLEEYQRGQRSERSPETEEVRQVRLMMTDAQRALSALYKVRNALPKADARAEIHKAIREIAQEAVRLAESGEVDRRTFQAREDAAKLELKRLEAAQ